MIVRVLVNDDRGQAATARRILAQPFALGATVLLETEWLLRSRYQWPRAAIVAGLTEILDLPTVVEAPVGARWALGRYSAGADFADMIHLITAGSVTHFVTFDRRLAARAGADAPIPIETLA